MPLTAVLVSVASFASALFGGFLALRAMGQVGMIIAIGAGIRIGAAFFDLIPEAVELVGGSLDQVMLATTFGFVVVLRDREADGGPRRPRGGRPSWTTARRRTATSA